MQHALKLFIRCLECLKKLFLHCGSKTPAGTFFTHAARPKI